MTAAVTPAEKAALLATPAPQPSLTFRSEWLGTEVRCVFQYEPAEPENGVAAFFCVDEIHVGAWEASQYLSDLSLHAVEGEAEEEFHRQTQEAHDEARIDAYSGGSGIAQADANARLIAAAPDILDALRETSACFGGHADEFSRRVLAQVRAAIAKATGSDA